jgi:tetratricopeptide (TPR) repeat protein
MKTLVPALFLVWVSNVASLALSAELGPPSSRGTASPPTNASASFRQGVELYREANFEAALVEFRKAYQLSPSYKVLYNIAETYFELHDYVNAQTNLRQYLSEGGSEIAAERRAEVQDIFEKLAERIAYLEIDTDLAGADVRIDDLSVGTSPLPAPIPVNIGRRRVSVVKQGFAPLVTLVTATNKERLVVTLDSTDLPLLQPSESLGSSASLTNTEITRRRAPSGRSNTLFVSSVTATAVFAVATGTFAWLTLDAKSRFENQLGKLQNSKSPIDDERSTMKTYGYLTDGFGAATLISGGVALYLALTSSSSTEKRKEGQNARSVVLAPTLGGMAVHGSW